MNVSTLNKDINSNSNLLNSSSSLLNNKADGDIRNEKSNSKENMSGNATEENYSYLRFDVTRYADPDRDINNITDAIFSAAENQFYYLKFDASKYVNPDDLNSVDMNTTVNEISDDFSYLKFDVTKYSGNDLGIVDDEINP